MFESPAELAKLQSIIDRSRQGAGEHLLAVITPDKAMSASDICEELTGMRLVTVSTVSKGGRPLAGPADGYLVHGELYFSSSPQSVKIRHLQSRPSVSAVYLPSAEIAISFHGTAELFDFADPRGEMLQKAMLDHYLPIQGEDFSEWLEDTDAVGVVVRAEKVFGFRMR